MFQNWGQKGSIGPEPSFLFQQKVFIDFHVCLVMIH